MMSAVSAMSTAVPHNIIECKKVTMNSFSAEWVISKTMWTGKIILNMLLCHWCTSKLCGQILEREKTEVFTQLSCLTLSKTRVEHTRVIMQLNFEYNLTPLWWCMKLGMHLPCCGMS